ncbi:MAG: thermonuclease family protein [Planctomycetes bacterium]|nr:thermonuclease family protein [Planctomycetota bacterium]
MNRHVPFAVALAATFTCAVFAFQQQDAAPSKPFSGKVVGISDGDTITVLVDKTTHKIRLNGIDAPESGQVFGTKSKQALGDKVFGKEVKIEWNERDRYGRIIGEVFID